jgi:hypothetical protein
MMTAGETEMANSLSRPKKTTRFLPFLNGKKLNLGSLIKDIKINNVNNRSNQTNISRRRNNRRRPSR